MELCLAETGNLAESSLNVTPLLRQQLASSLGSVSQRLKQSTTVQEFFLEFQELLSSLSSPPVLHRAHHYAELITELDAIGWDMVSHLDDTWTNLTLCGEFDGRSHRLEIHLQSTYPATPPEVLAQLPNPLDIDWRESYTLSNLVGQWKTALTRYSELWTELDRIDANCWVLEPETPTRADCSRRIFIELSCALNILLQPAAARAIPLCSFVGSDTTVAEYRSRLNRNISRWDSSISVFDNLSHVLELTFPQRQQVQQAGLQTVCDICGLYRFEDQIPDVMCNNARCGHVFHSVCLIEWLQGMAQTRQSFDTLFGTCTHCDQPISVRRR